MTACFNSSTDHIKFSNRLCTRSHMKDRSSQMRISCSLKLCNRCIGRQYNSNTIIGDRQCTVSQQEKCQVDTCCKLQSCPHSSCMMSIYRHTWDIKVLCPACSRQHKSRIRQSRCKVYMSRGMAHRMNPNQSTWGSSHRCKECWSLLWLHITKSTRWWRKVVVSLFIDL